MIKNILKNPLTWIFIFSLFIRIYKLGVFPYGFHVDEVKVAWNAESILKTGKDDKNQKLFLYYNSFGDYRPSGIFYLTIPSIYFLGQSEFATRLPTALIGALMIFPIYFLVKLFSNKDEKIIYNLKISHIGAFIMAISPWGIELSRATNEVVTSTFFALFALYFFIKLIKTSKIRFAFLSTLFILPSYLMYHPIRFLGPPFFIITLIYYFFIYKVQVIKKTFLLPIIFVLILSITFSLTKEGLARFDQISIFKDVDTTYQINRIKSESLKSNILTFLFDNKWVIYTKSFLDQYSKYFAGDFLIGQSAKPFRFATPGVGLITYVEAILLIFGIKEILKGKVNYLPLLLLLITPLPAAITAEDAPNLSRAFMMLPFLTIIEAYGFRSLLSVKKTKRFIFYLTSLLLVGNFIYFTHMYFDHAINHRPYLKDYSGDSPTYRDIGAKELALKLDGFRTKYDKIILTNFPDSIYPWYAFFTNKDPADFNKNYKNSTNERDYENIIFSEEKCPGDDALTKYPKNNILIVDSWECQFTTHIQNGYPLKIVGTITRPDGSMVYTLLERDWSKPLIINGIYIN